MLISIVIPCYRSADTLPAVSAEIRNAFSQHPEHDYQLILVNDSPTHAETCRTIRELCAADSKILGIELARNFGQARARMAALPYINGDCAVYMDDDGQHPAEGIFPLVKKIEEGYDVAYAKFENKKHSFFKRTTSRMYRKFLEMLGVRPKGVASSSFVAWSKFSVDALKNYHSPYPATGAYLLKVTSRITDVPTEHRKRIAGKSGYSLSKMFNLALTGITNFTAIPLRASAIVGIVIALIGFLYGLFLIIKKLIVPTAVMGYTSLMVVMLLLGGLILIVLGLMGEYIGSMYMILSDMPQFLIREVIRKETGAEVKEAEPAAQK